MDALGAVDRAASQRIGSATYAVLYAVARSMLDGGAGLVLESNFRRGISDRELAPLVERSRAIFVHCTVPDADRRRRYAGRDRHPGHFDSLLIAAWDSDTTAFGPPDVDGLTVIHADGTAPSAKTVGLVARRLAG